MMVKSSMDCGVYGVANFNTDVSQKEPEASLTEKLEDVMLGHDQVKITERHIFSEGMYCKEIIIPKGTLAIGHAHTGDFMQAITKGKMIMYAEGQPPMIAKAPFIGVGLPFKRKVGYALEDTVWATFHATDETDIQKLEDELVVKSCTWLSHEKLAIDRDDYKRVLRKVGISHETAKEQSENKDDQISMPAGYSNVNVSESEIEGQGIFVTTDVKKGDIIAPGRIDGKRTPAGRFTNHSAMPNAKMVKRANGNIDLIATKDICSQEVTIDYLQALSLSINIEVEK